MAKFSVHAPGWQFSETCEADSEKEVRQRYRDEYGGRLPNGFEVWPYEPLPGLNDPLSAMRYQM